MRKSHSVRSYTRSGSSNVTMNTDELGMVREDESAEDALRRQLLEKDRENDRLRSQIDQLQVQLSQRPPLETVQELEKEYKSLEILLQGTQRENERCMSDLERGKNREKMLERELEKLAGANWQSSLEITSPAATRSAFATSFNASSSSSAPKTTEASQATLAHIEQVRLLILGMEQRLQLREEKLEKTVEAAQAQGARLEEMQVALSV